MKSQGVQPYSVHLIYIGNGYYQVFIKNNSSDAKFIRIIVGYSEMINGERIAKIARSWIISPLKIADEQVFIHEVNKTVMNGRRFWVAFQAMQRGKRKSIPLDSFLALSPAASKWRKTIGASTYFEIKSIDSIKSLEEPLQLEQLLELKAK